MRIFVTGASGWIGSATVVELLANGHTVVGLARSDHAAATVEALGAAVVRGSLDDLDTLRAAASDSDGVVHLGYVHDFTRMADAAVIDAAAIEAIGGALAGSGKPLLVASGVLGLATGGRAGTEDDLPDPAMHPRVANAAATLALSDRGVRSIVARFAPTVHGPGDHGFIASIVGFARQHGRSPYVGNGDNRWPAVHRLDAARLVRVAMEQAEPRTVLHATAEVGVRLRDIATGVGHGLDVPVVSIPPEEAAAHFDWLSFIIGVDAPTASDITQARFGWTPAQPTLLEDLAGGAYFTA